MAKTYKPKKKKSKDNPKALVEMSKKNKDKQLKKQKVETTPSLSAGKAKRKKNQTPDEEKRSDLHDFKMYCYVAVGEYNNNRQLSMQYRDKMRKLMDKYGKEKMVVWDISNTYKYRVELRGKTRKVWIELLNDRNN